MAASFGAPNVDLTTAVRRVAKGDSSAVLFSVHAQQEMDNDGFDHADVMTCLRKGIAHGPEYVKGQLRANVVHRGLHIRVVVGGLEDGPRDRYRSLLSLRVITVMKDG